jgi:hypothetical protein
VRPELHDSADELGREAIERRRAAAAFRAPTSLRLRREQKSELVDVSPAVGLPTVRFGLPASRVNYSLQIRVVYTSFERTEFSAGAEEGGI